MRRKRAAQAATKLKTNRPRPAQARPLSEAGDRPQLAGAERKLIVSIHDPECPFFSENTAMRNESEALFKALGCNLRSADGLREGCATYG